jgi:hypothetical protein
MLGLNEILGELLILPDIEILGDVLGLTDKLGLGLAPLSKKKKYFIVTLLARKSHLVNYT